MPERGAQGCRDAAEKAEIVLQGVQSGSGAGGDGDKSLQTQLTEANAAVADATAAAKTRLSPLTGRKGARGREETVRREGERGAKLKDLASAEETHANAKLRSRRPAAAIRPTSPWRLSARPTQPTRLRRRLTS